MKAFITGGAGFIGSHVAREFLEQGNEVVVYDDLSSGYESNLAGLDVDFVQADIRDPDKLTAAMKGADTVCHLAASVGNKRAIDNPVLDSEINAIGTINVLEAMRENNVPTIIYSSSAGIFGEPRIQPVPEEHPTEPDSPYGASKLAGEKLALVYQKLYGMRVAAFRYFNVYGENQRFDAYGNVIPIFATNAFSGADITIYGDGKQTRDFIHVSDLAKATYHAAGHDNIVGAYNLGTGTEIRIDQLADWSREITESSSAIVHTDERPGDVRHCTADVSRFNRDFDWTPKPIDKNLLRDYFSWLKQDQQVLAA